MCCELHERLFLQDLFPKETGVPGSEDDGKIDG